MKRRIIQTRTPLIEREHTTRTGGLIRRQPKIAGRTVRIRERKMFPWRPILRIVFASLIVASVVWLLNSPLFTVRAIAVQGLSNVPEKLVLDQVPRRSNLWLFPTRQTSARIKKASPLIADVGVYRIIPDTIRVVVAERKPGIDWQVQDRHFLIGTDGTVIEEAALQIDLPRVVDTVGAVPNPGAAVVTPGFVHFIQALQNQFEKVVGLPLDHLEISETTFDVTALPKSGPKILFDSTRSSDVQLQAAKLVLDQFKDQIHEYVDMRVPGKAYYK